ncbi:hypothetical protein M5E89_04890 [Acidaminococcus intestini]|nr:hypothetical protein M5E89_04890 [Acidaminococcus intestini]
MDNVYDYINDFYTNDDGWNMVIPRDDVETYIRKCAWQGMDDKALQKSGTISASSASIWKMICWRCRM